MATVSDTTQPKPSSSALIAIAWLVVILPTAWGLEHTVQNAIKIFTRPGTPAAAPANPGPAVR